MELKCYKVDVLTSSPVASAQKQIHFPATCVCVLSSSLGHLVPVVLQLKAVRYYLCKVCYLIVKLCGSIYDEFSIIMNCALSKELEANLVRTTSQEARCAL